MYDLLTSIEADIAGAQMCADVAVVASLKPCYYGHYSYHREVSRALADAGIAHEMLAPRRLHGERLARYRAIVLPNTAVLSEESFRALLDYRGEGGSVIAFGAVGTLDDRGRDGPAQGWGDDTGFTTVDLDPDQLARDNAKVTYDPEMIQHAAWARGQWSASLRPTMAAVVGQVERAAAGRLLARRHEPDAVEISVMRRPQADDLILHAVNYAVDIEGVVAPAENVRISVHVPPDKDVAGIDWHALDGVKKALPTSRCSERVEFTVPRLEVYGIAIVRVAAGPT